MLDRKIGRGLQLVIILLGSTFGALTFAGHVWAQPAILSGTIYYAGTRGVVSSTQPIRLVLVHSFDEDPVASAVVTSNGGAYQIEAPNAGTYYLGYFFDTDGDGEPLGDPVEIYNNRFKVPGDSIAVPQTNVALDFDDTLVYEEIESKYRVEVQGNANGFILFGSHTNSLAPTLELFYQDFSVTGDGGGSTSGAEFLLPPAGHSPPLKSLPPALGQTWNDTDDSGSSPAAASLVVALNETVTVGAGTFTNCVKVEETVTYPLGIPPGQTWPTFYRRWFAPGVGPVRLTIMNSDGTEDDGELTHYETPGAAAADYFPLAANYSWVFTMVASGRSVAARVVAATGGCVGDCNEDGQATVDELLALVNIALGNANVSSCWAGDGNVDGQITIDEILTAVNAALNGC